MHVVRKTQKDSSPLWQGAIAFLWLNKGPWSDLDGHTRVPSRGARAEAAGAISIRKTETRGIEPGPDAACASAGGRRRLFYGDPAQREQQLSAVPYSKQYSAISRSARLLSGSRFLTGNASSRNT